MKKTYVWGIVGLIVVILAAWALMGKKTADSNPNASATPKVSGTPGASSQPSATPVPTKTTGTTPKPSAPTSNLSYGEAIKVYAGTRIQFNAQCQASPNSITIKNGQSVMFDNRSGDARWFSLNGTGYYIAGYGFRVLPLSSKTLPVTYTVDCGSAQNVAKVIVQK